MKEIKVANGQAATLVDDDVYEWAAKIKWSLNHHGYATHRDNKKRKNIFLHKEVIDCPAGMQRDHINRNRLDNRRANLRIVTPAENARNRKTPKHNTSGFKGVRFEKGRYWRAFIGLNGKKKHIGYFKTKEDAAHAYDKAAKENYGEFASLNFPE